MRYLLLSFLVGVSAWAVPTPDDFVRYFNDHYAGTRAAPRARDLHYIFVAGFLNEHILGYFDDNIRELKRLGVPASRISIVRPKSDRTFEENSAELRKDLAAIFRRETDRAVVFAHSRGAVDALAFALAN